MHLLAAFALLSYSIVSGSGVPEVDHRFWLRNQSRQALDYVDVFSDSALLEPTSVVEPCSEEGLLWIFVSSAVQNFKERQRIRETWGHKAFMDEAAFSLFHKGLEKHYENATESFGRVRLTFLLGKTRNSEQQKLVEEEHKVHGDVLQEDFFDSYYNLTLKSIFMLKWAANNPCVNKYKFVAKCDDNVFLNIPNLVQVLRGGTIPKYKVLYSIYRKEFETGALKKAQLESLLMGKAIRNTLPPRKPTSRYYLPRYMYSADKLPDYLEGSAYVMSRSVAAKLFSAALSELILPVEDAYITGVLAKKVGVSPLNSNLFQNRNYPGVCENRALVLSGSTSTKLAEPKYLFGKVIKCDAY